MRACIATHPTGLAAVNVDRSLLHGPNAAPDRRFEASKRRFDASKRSIRRFKIVPKWRKTAATKDPQRPSGLVPNTPQTRKGG